MGILVVIAIALVTAIQIIIAIAITLILAISLTTIIARGRVRATVVLIVKAVAKVVLMQQY